MLKSWHREFDGRDVPASVAGKEAFFEPELAERSLRGASACAVDVCAATGLAGMPHVLTRLERLQLVFRFPRASFCIERARLHLFFLLLKIRVLGLVVRKLGLQEFKVLAKYRRRAMLGYQAIQRVEKLAKDVHEIS